MSGRCTGDCALISSVARDMGKASDQELAAIKTAVSDMLGKHEARMGGDLVTALCRWSEAADRHLTQRTAAVPMTVTKLAAKAAS
jgi:hypothetical protein